MGGSRKNNGFKERHEKEVSKADIAHGKKSRLLFVSFILFPGIQVVSIDESLSSIFLNSILFLCS
jgi:hypothetical protein